MSLTTLTLVDQLNTLLRLTAAEAATARSRVVQAPTRDTREELLANATKCDERAAAIRAAIVDLGGAPDVLGMALAKALTLGKLPLDQTLPITEALLLDLALEHQLFDRARLVKVLAHEAQRADVVSLAERLENAHGETIQWLFTVLGETAVGGPAALVPTPAQTAAAVARTTVTYGGAVTAKAVNRTAATLSGVTETARSLIGSAAASATTTVTSTVDARLAQARTLAQSAAKVFTAGRDASLETAQEEARREDAPRAAKVIYDMRAATGSLDGSELPIPAYDDLTVKDAAAAVNKLETAHDVRIVVVYETANKARHGVIDAAEKRIASIAGELIGS